ncbi:hypothetical protein HYW53_02950 [Candidatus Giovannonibacteria bacterium]|nr:hypothetical protein [Candidatus Giovannonibacteria bacterium]
MSKNLFAKLSVLLILLAAGSSVYIWLKQPREIKSDTSEAEIRALVSNFGGALKKVTRLAPREIYVKSIQENYSDFITPELMKKWEEDPASALGRQTSSPWPERIEISEIKKISDTSYEVKGEIIEVTSMEVTSGGIAAKRSAEFTVDKLGEKFLISAVSVGSYMDPNLKTVKDPGGFDFMYPEKFETEYVGGHEWPPKIEIKTGIYSCKPGEAKNSNGLPDAKTSEKKIGNVNYCIEESMGAAAGSAYTEYAYVFSLDGKLMRMTFALRFPNCENYADQTIVKKCKSEQEMFNLDMIIGDIVNSIRFRDPNEGKTGIKGKVFLGPLCPVVREGEECPDRPFETKLGITTPNEWNLIKEIKSDSKGEFFAEIAPGEYAIRSIPSDKVFPYCISPTFKVETEKITEIQVSCDTGIR